MAEDPNAKPNNDAAGNEGASASTLLSGKGSAPADGVAPGSDASAAPADKAAADKAAADKAAADKAAADKAAADKAAADKAAKDKEGAPAEYKFSAPEGVQLDQTMLGKFSTLAKDLNLSQEKAQSLVNLAAENQASVLKAQKEQWDVIRQGWKDELKADTEFGGAKFNETVQGAKRALAKFGSDKFVEFLESTGYGDNAELIRLLARVDKATREDRGVDGAPPAKEQSAAQVMYPNQGKE